MSVSLPISALEKKALDVSDPSAIASNFFKSNIFFVFINYQIVVLN